MQPKPDRLKQEGASAALAGHFERQLAALYSALPRLDDWNDPARQMDFLRAVTETFPDEFGRYSQTASYRNTIEAVTTAQNPARAVRDMAFEILSHETTGFWDWLEMRAIERRKRKTGE